MSQSNSTPSPTTEPDSVSSESPPAVEEFISRWKGKDGGERSNYQLFISELCDLLEVPRPYPSSSNNTENAYVFERSVEMVRTESGVRSQGSQESSPNLKSKIENLKSSTGFIDCYKRGAFVFETKQGVEKKEREALSEVGRQREAKRRTGHGVRGTVGWDTALIKARNQADRYARNLPPSEGRPPFLIVADVGHCIELYSEF